MPNLPIIHLPKLLHISYICCVKQIDEMLKIDLYTHTHSIEIISTQRFALN